MRRIWIWLLCLYFVMTFVSAASDVVLVNSQSGDLVENSFVTLVLSDGTERYFYVADSTFSLDLEEPFAFELFVDAPLTEGFDYYGVFDSTMFGAELFVSPVGSVSGFVVDSLENVVSGAALQVRCDRNLPYDYPTLVDSFGSFEFVLPEGDCTIISQKGNLQGSISITIRKGDSSQVQLQIQETGSSYFWLILVVGLFILVVIAILSRKRIFGQEILDSSKHRVVKSQKSPFTKDGLIKVAKKADLPVEKETSSDHKSNSSSFDVLSVLSKNERIIVEYFRNNANTACHLSKIHKDTGLSKSSLFRNIKKLEEKKIVIVEEFGRQKKISLTKRFLQK